LTALYFAVYKGLRFIQISKGGLVMNRLRIALGRINFLVTFCLAAGTIGLLIPSTGAAFSNSSLTGGYGCVAQVILNDSSGTLQGISEVMRLNFNGAGQVAGGIILNLQGEVCNIQTTGPYNIKPSGFGSIKLTWNTATGDADGDATCSVLNAQAISQNMSLVVEGHGTTFDFQGADDFLTSPLTTTDSDVQAPFTGSCKTQS
jgi:hypothetical protein